MIITNKLELPAPLVDMAKRDNYKLKNNEYRVTSLLKGVRETILERRHEDEIERDVSDMVFLLFGTAVHSVLENHREGDQEIKEARLKIPIGDYILSGQFDLYNAETKTITDYKTCSIWKVIYGEYEDWRRQLLIYAYMLQSIGFPVKKAEIIALMKDHTKSQAKRKADYPKQPVRKITFHFSDEDFAEIQNWLHQRFEEIAQAEKMSDDELPLCTLEERFNDGDKFAVMRKGRKTALRVLDSMEDAKYWMAANGGDYIETRKGEDKKCMDYCSACEFCNYYKEVVANG